MRCWKPVGARWTILEQTGEPGLVLAGRGYNIYDRGVNCDIPRKLRHRYGANVIPLDFLVTGREPLSTCTTTCSGSPAARFWKPRASLPRKPNLHMVYITNFKCGPDSLHQALRARSRRRAAADPAIRRSRQRCRLHDALRSVPRQQRNSAMLPHLPAAATAEPTASEYPLNGKRIYIPPMAYGSARAFAAAFRAIGLDAEPTPPSDHRTRELGARYTSGDECYPAKVTVGDFMKVLEKPDTDPARVALFMPTAQGPCRFGQYAPYLRQILDANGYRAVEILSPTSQNAYDGLGTLAEAFRAHRLARAALRRPAAEAAADLPALRRCSAAIPSSLRRVAGGSVRHARIDTRRARRPIAGAARLHGALPRPFPQTGRWTRPVAAR